MENIKWVKVDNRVLDRSEWENKKVFQVKCGQTVSYSIATQTRNRFEVVSRTMNGVNIGSTTGMLMDSETLTDVNFLIKAMVNNPMRFKITCKDYENILVSQASELTLTGVTTDFVEKNIAAGYYLDFAPKKGYYIEEIILNGTTPLKLDREGTLTYTAGAMDDVFEVKVKPYDRNIPLDLYVDAGTLNYVYVVFNLGGPNNRHEEFTNGRHSIMVHPCDFPIYVGESNPAVYVGGEIQSPVEEGSRMYINEVPVGKEVRIYSAFTSSYPVTINDFSGTVTMDGKEITPGTYFVLPGTVFEFTPSAAPDGMILQTGKYTYEEPKDGKFIFTPVTKSIVTLRNKDLLTIKCDENWRNMTLLEENSGEQYELQGASTTIVLPQGVSEYKFSVTDTDGIYRVSTITGATQADNDKGTFTATRGGTITLTTEKNPNPYFLNIHVVPQDFQYYEYDRTSGKYYGGLDGNIERSSDIIAMRNGVDMDMNINYLRYGDNNFNRDYTLHEEYDENRRFFGFFAPTQHEFYNLNVKEFPVTVYNPSDNYSQIYVINDGETTIVQPGEFYDIELINGVYNYDVHIYESEPLLVPIRFDGDSYYCKVGSNPEEFVGSPKASSYTVDLSTTVKLRPVEDQEIEYVTLKLKTGYSGDVYADIYTVPDEEYADYYSVNENGEYEISFNSGLFSTGHTSSFGSQFAVEVGFKQFEVNVTSSLAEAGVYFAERYVGSQNTIGVINLNNAKVTCKQGYRVTSITDETGQRLPFDVSTGIVSGLTEGMSVMVNVEKYDRNLTFNLKYQGTNASPKFDTEACLKLAPNTLQEYAVKLNYVAASANVNVKFNPEDAPFSLQNASYSKGNYNAEVYLNNKEIECVNGVYNFPVDVPDNSTLLILRPNKSVGNVGKIMVNYEIEEGLKVNATASDIFATSALGIVMAPVTSVIKVTPQEDNRYNYTAQYSLDGGVNWNNLDATNGYTIALTDKQLSVRVLKNVYKVTFVAGDDVDLSKVSVFADEEEIKLDDNNTASIPTGAETVRIVTSVADTYLTADVPDGMAFDKNLGTLAGKVNGTVTLHANKVIRENNLTVFVENDKLAAGKLVLGCGNVTEDSLELSAGYQTIKFNEELLPIVYRIGVTSGDASDEDVDHIEGDFDPAYPETMPMVFVNGEQQEYDGTFGGYRFPDEAFTGDTAPVIKIYAPGSVGENRPAIFYIVEDGINFRAVEDHSTEVTEPGLRDVLPYTHIELTAQSVNDVPVFVEVDGSVVEPVDGKYTIMTGNSDMTIAVKLRKIKVTVNTDNWESVSVAGNGYFHYLTSETSVLEFPMGTTTLKFAAEFNGTHISNITSTNSNVEYDSVSGELTGLTDGTVLNIEWGEYQRDIELMVYVEENEDSPITHLVLGEGSAIETVIALIPGYQTVMINPSDLPLAVRTTAESVSKVYVNGEEIEHNGINYVFPSELPEFTVVKIFSEQQEPIELSYSVSLPGYVFKVWHDRLTGKEIDLTATHQVLPGTEINFTITPVSEPAQIIRRVKARAEETVTNKVPSVTVNDEKLEADENGVYTVKVDESHRPGGLQIKASAVDDISTSIEGLAEEELYDVYDLNGCRLRSRCTKDEVSRLPSGIYMINGEKRLVR